MVVDSVRCVSVRGESVMVVGEGEASEWRERPEVTQKVGGQGDASNYMPLHQLFTESSGNQRYFVSEIRFLRIKKTREKRIYIYIHLFFFHLFIRCLPAQGLYFFSFRWCMCLASGVRGDTS